MQLWCHRMGWDIMGGDRTSRHGGPRIATHSRTHPVQQSLVLMGCFRKEKTKLLYAIVR